MSFNVVSTRTSTPPSGRIKVKLGFVHPPSTAALMDFAEVYADLVKLSRPSLVSAPPVSLTTLTILGLGIGGLKNASRPKASAPFAHTRAGLSSRTMG